MEILTSMITDSVVDRHPFFLASALDVSEDHFAAGIDCHLLASEGFSLRSSRVLTTMDVPLTDAALTVSNSYG